MDGNTVVDLTQGPLSSKFEAAVRYLVSWLDSRMNNLAKGNQRKVARSGNTREEAIIPEVESSEEEEE